jgi:antirestriction protein ArdC
MKEKTPQEQTAAARQVELLSNALNGASTEGYWLNVSGRLAPKIYPKGAPLSPFNSLTLMLDADSHGYSTALYTTFQEARKRGESVLKEERSVPMNWYRWDSYVNKHDEKDIISRDDYRSLPPVQQEQYKAVRKREIHSLFNVEQTTLPHVDEKEFEKLRQQFGGRTDRGNILAEERQTRSAVNRFREQISQNLVPIRKSTTGTAAYDTGKDAVYIPDQKHFGNYMDYVQELVRQVVSATGHRERMSREGMVMNGGKAPSGDALRYERLVAEIASGLKMAEFGLPAKLSPESRGMVEYWTEELKENPCLIDAVESDVNNALDVIRKAEKGERMESAHERNKQQTEELREQEEGRPQVSVADALVLQDILRKGGMEINDRNFPGGQDDKREFLARFDGLRHYDTLTQDALTNARLQHEDPELVNIAYTQAAGSAARIHRLCSEWLPQEWEEKGAHVIADDINAVPDKRSREFVVVLDKNTGIADVVLPTAARSGGDVVMPNGDRRNYWMSPDEVMTADERKEAGARVVSHTIPGFNKEKIAAVLMAQGASYVRFYNKDGQLRYHPDDSYFADKQVYSARLDGREIRNISAFDVSEAVRRATEVRFERIQMLRDDTGGWALYLKPENEPSFSIRPDKNDINRFFSTVKQDDRVAAGAVRNELAQKYYALAQAEPNLKVDLFGAIPDGIDPLRIKRVNVFKSKDDKILCVPVIDGIDKVQPREVSKQQWQRMWVAEDVAQYKTCLAASLFADLLIQKTEEQTVEKQQTEDAAVVRPDVAAVRPELQQYEELKEKHPDVILLFRHGGNYEAYQDDVPSMEKTLGLEKIEFGNQREDTHAVKVSFPTDMLDVYLPKLVRSGARVAICDAVENISADRKASMSLPQNAVSGAENMERHTGIRM